MASQHHTYVTVHFSSLPGARRAWIRLVRSLDAAWIFAGLTTTKTGQRAATATCHVHRVRQQTARLYTRPLLLTVRLDRQHIADNRDFFLVAVAHVC